VYAIDDVDGTNNFFVAAVFHSRNQLIYLNCQKDMELPAQAVVSLTQTDS
jgi:hypothetical protein